MRAVLPRSVRQAFTHTMGTAWWSSPHMLDGSTVFKGVLFGLSAIAALALLIGYRTRAAGRNAPTGDSITIVLVVELTWRAGSASDRSV